MIIQWNEDYKMGIELLDEEHAQLFEIAKKIIDRMMEHNNDPNMRLFVVREGLTFINNYFAEHAKHEEAYMRKINYNGYAVHKMLHDDFYNIELEKYRKIVENGSCDKKEVYDFIGSAIGWLLEHVAITDMAIVGKGILAKRTPLNINEEVLEKEVNRMFQEILHINANAEIVKTDYRGEYFGKAFYQKLVYGNGNDTDNIIVITGIEKAFVLDVAKIIYGDEIEDEIDLVLPTLQSFTVNFWRSLGMRFVGDAIGVKLQESSFMMKKHLAEEIKKLDPKLSVLFTSDKGKFFLASNIPYPVN